MISSTVAISQNCTSGQVKLVGDRTSRTPTTMM
jgi:hypothetical protein